MSIINLTEKLNALHPKFKNVKHYKFNPSIFKGWEEFIFMFYRVYISDSHPWETTWSNKLFDGIGFAMFYSSDYELIQDRIILNSNGCHDPRGFLSKYEELKLTFNIIDENHQAKIAISHLCINLKSLTRIKYLYPNLQEGNEKNWSHIFYKNNDRFIERLNPKIEIAMNKNNLIITDSKLHFKNIIEYYGQNNYKIQNSDGIINKIENNVNFSLSTQTLLKNGNYIGIGHIKILSKNIKIGKLKQYLDNTNYEKNHYNDLVYLHYMYKLNKKCKLIEISEGFTFNPNNPISFASGIIENDNDNDLFDISYGLDDESCLIYKNFDIKSLIWYDTKNKLIDPKNYNFKNIENVN